MSGKNTEPPREHWGSRIGLVLAMAGNAVGLGNFLRFPTQAAANGGGAYMIPYFIAFFILGIPLMWIEWGLGRYGGGLGHGTMPGILHRLIKKRAAKYLGVLGIVLPLFVVIYYNYIESWTLSYSWFSITGQYAQIEGKNLAERKIEMGRFLQEFQGIPKTVKIKRNIDVSSMDAVKNCIEQSQVPTDLIYDSSQHGAWDTKNPKLDQTRCPYQEISLKRKYFSTNNVAYIFFVLTILANFYFLYRGLSAGIEQLGKIGMPILFAFGIILAIRVMTFGQPEGSSWSVADGFNFLWTPSFKELGSASVWLAAAGQIFFTLSLGQGAIAAYASYLSNKDDIVLSGLATASTNEFAEVILGGSIAIPAAVAFFGPEMTTAIAKGGAFDLGFQSLPMIFSKISMGWFFGTIWFALLFIAGITSSVALFTPAVAFLKDEMKMSHSKAVCWVCGACFLLTHGAIFFIKQGVIDEMDYWAGTFGLVVFALIEVIAFMWIFGSEQAWKEMHKGCDIKIPRIFLFIMKYLTPLYIISILIVWGIQDGWATLIMEKVDIMDRPFIWWTRFGMIALTAVFVQLTWRRFGIEDEEPYWVPICVWGFPMLFLLASYPGLFAIETNALLLLVISWTIVLSLVIYSIRKMITIPIRKHDDFPDEAANPEIEMKN